MWARLTNFYRRQRWSPKQWVGWNSRQQHAIRKWGPFDDYKIDSKDVSFSQLVAPFFSIGYPTSIFSVLFWYVFEAQRSLPCQFIHIQHILPFASATPETCILLSSFHCSVHSLLQWIVYQKLLWCLILLGCFSSLELLLPFLIPINYPAVNQKSI